MTKAMFFLFSLVCFSSVFSQVTTSNIRGIIADDQAAPLLGANVVAVHGPTGTRYGAITNEDGRFNLLNLRVGGPYSIVVSYVGYKSHNEKGVFLTLGKTHNVKTSLLLASETLDEVILISDRSGTFGSGRTGAETSVGRRELTRLPTISRSAADFTRLEPSASGNSFGGRNDQYNNFSLDGAIFNNPFGLDSPTPGGQTGAQPISLDAIDQISVSIAPYDVTQSGFTGASVNAVTKSGTNEFHGTVYGFYRNEDLTGGKINGEDVSKPDLNQKQYGLSIGGPIIKNKLFFFMNFEKDDRDDLGTNGFIPNTGTGAINETRVLESDLVRVQNAMTALGYNTGRYQGFTYGSESTKGILKLDWNINENNRLAVIYNFLDASQEKPAHPTALGVRGPSFETLQFQNSGYQINNKIQSVQLELNSTLSDEIVNKLQIGYTHFDDFRNPLSTPSPSLLIQDGAGSNYIIVGHEPFSIHNTLDQKVFQFTNNMNIFSGNHTFTVGFSFEKFQFDNSFNLGVYGGTFGVPIGDEFRHFASVDEFIANAGSGGVVDGLIKGAEATFAANNQVSVGEPGGWQLAETNVGQLSFYLQDEWNVTEQLKLTYGFRFDKPLYFDTKEKIRENINRKGTYQPDNEYIDPETNQPVKIDSEKLPSNNILVSPRLGFNWDTKGDGTTQIRGGTGVFTGRFPFVWLGNQVQGVDFFFYQVVDPDFKWPQVWRTNVGVDHRFKNGIISTLDLSYTKDINGAHVQNWGLSSPSGQLNAPGDNRPVYTAEDRALNAFGGPTNAYVFTNSDKGRSFNASLKLQKTFDNGVFASVAYNYLNAKDVNSIEAEITGDAFDFNPTAGNANQDVLAFSKYGDTHRFIGVAIKQFNYGNGKYATSVSGFFEYAQGGRYNYTYAGNINGDSSFQNNDLLYIPTSSELQQMNFSGAGQAEAFERYIQQDNYLSDHRGEIMERYGALAPWRGTLDVKILQDFNFAISDGKKQTLQLSIDILNFGNLINSNWGVVEIPNDQTPLSVTSIDANGVPTFTFDTNLVETNGFDASLLSRWQAQFGVRYIF